MDLANKIEDKTVVLALLGLGYVGLPLAVEFGKKYKVIGFDINEKRVDELRSGKDRTLEVNTEELSEAKELSFTTKLDELKKANVFIVTVPTPVDDFKVPDLTPVLKASETVGKVIKKGDVVKIFLLAKGVEYEKLDSEQFNIREQTRLFLEKQGEIFACGTCLKSRESDGTETCPMSTMHDLYLLVKESDKVLTF